MRRDGAKFPIGVETELTGLEAFTELNPETKKSVRGFKQLEPRESLAVVAYLDKEVLTGDSGASFCQQQAPGKTGIRWPRNGAKLYLDIGSHPEYATPSFNSAAAVARHLFGFNALAGEAMDGYDKDTMLVSRTLDTAGGACGFHENYHGSLPVEGYGPVILAHLISSATWAGAGAFRYNDEGRLGIIPAQKLFVAEKLQHEKTVGNDRPVFNLRDEPHAAEGTRLHVVSRDHPTSPEVLWLRLATTSIIMRLIEADAYPPELSEKLMFASIAHFRANKGKDICLQPYASSEEISLEGVRRWLTDPGTKNISLLNIQDGLISCTEEAVANGKITLTNEEAQALAVWRYVVDKLKLVAQDANTLIDDNNILSEYQVLLRILQQKDSVKTAMDFDAARSALSNKKPAHDAKKVTTLIIKHALSSVTTPDLTPFSRTELLDPGKCSPRDKGRVATLKEYLAMGYEIEEIDWAKLVLSRHVDGIEDVVALEFPNPSSSEFVIKQNLTQC